MPRTRPPSPVWQLIPEHPSIPALAAAAVGCQACGLHKDATRTVFGAGPERASAAGGSSPRWPRT